MKINLNDTIVAPATNIAKQAISIIRVSGDNSFEIVNKILKKDLEKVARPQLRKIFDKETLIDEALLIPFVGKNSFTGEDSIEINCHGGILIVKNILKLLIKNGARMALNGEFSQRAYLNGKVNLIQTQGIQDLIDSKNDLSLKLNAINMSGQNNKLLEIIKDDIVDVISRIQTSIDYPDYDDIEGSTPEELTIKLEDIKNKLKNIVDKSKIASKNQEGIKTVIAGNTNVGKSSLLNCLINEDKAIISNFEGTTRDIVEGTINLESVTLNLIDTAGIRNTEDHVENIGINKSKEYLTKADLILFVINKERFDLELYNQIVDRSHIVIVNKADLLSEKDREELKDKFKNVVFTSAANGDVDELIKKLKIMYNNEELLLSTDPILTNSNQIAQFEIMLEKIENAFINIKEGYPIDLINIDLYEANDLLNSLIGLVDVDEEILDNIFRKYCLGK